MELSVSATMRSTLKRLTTNAGPSARARAAHAGSPSTSMTASARRRGDRSRTDAACPVLRNCFADAADIQSDDGTTAGLSLDQDIRHALDHRRQEDDIERRVDEPDVGGRPRHRHPVDEAERGDAANDPVLQLAVAGDEKTHLGPCLGDLRSGIEPQIGVFLLDKTHHGADYRRALQPSELRPKPGNVIGGWNAHVSGHVAIAEDADGSVGNRSHCS